MIQFVNGEKWTRTPFFQDLINYLWENEGVTLRQLKNVFSTVPHMDRELERFINAGYIRRENRRYAPAFSLLEEADAINLGESFFLDNTSSAYESLLQRKFSTTVTNSTNAVVIGESVDIFHDSLALSSYFYKLREQLPMSEAQQSLYRLLGDVNPDYALKYLTTFLLKFTRKEEVLQKRRDVFVDALVLLGYICPIGSDKYRLEMTLHKDELLFVARDSSE